MRASTLLSTAADAFRSLYHRHLCRIDARSVASFVVDNGHALAKFGTTLLGLKLYHRLLLYLHELLNAGPMFFMLTLLGLLYTVGLGENTGAGSGVPSAYSVFNRGMARILGTVDGEELARQYAGGAAMAAAAGRMDHRGGGVGDFGDNDDDGDGDGVWVNDEEVEEEEERNLVNERRRQRRLERLRQQQRGDDDGIEGDNARVAEPPPRDAVIEGAAASNDGGDEEETGSEDERDRDEGRRGGPLAAANETSAAAAAPAPAAARKKSGKKARRQNLELRREMQRQRQAAAAMGFVGG